MKEFAKKYWITAILLLVPLVRHFSENSTIDALAGLIVWSSLWVVFAIMLIVLLVGSCCHFIPNEMKVEGMEKMTKPFAKLKWWKSLLTMIPILGVFIYVDWSGPAVLYTINVIGMWTCIHIMKSGIIKVCEAHGVELPEEDEKPDELKNLKKSLLD